MPVCSNGNSGTEETEPIYRFYDLLSELTRLRYESHVAGAPLESVPQEIEEALSKLLKELVSGVADYQRAGFIKLGRYLFFRIPQSREADKDLAEWLKTIEQATERQRQKARASLEEENRQLADAAEIGRAQQERARTIRSKHPPEVYENKVLELHEKDPEASWNVIQLRAALHLSVTPRTIRRRIGKKPW